MIFKFIRRIFLVLISILFIFILSVVGINIYVSNLGAGYIKTIEYVENNDCIIVLGAAVYDNTATEALAKRLDKAYEVYKQGKALKIIVSGDHGTTGYNEVSVMREYLVKRGVPKENIFMDHAGFNTFDTMYRARDIFLVKNAIVVTQKEHLLRALYIASKLGLNATGVESIDYDENEIQFQKPREFLARVKAFLQCEILHPQPKYLGDTIPVSGSGLVTED